MKWGNVGNNTTYILTILFCVFWSVAHGKAYSYPFYIDMLPTKDIIIREITAKIQQMVVNGKFEITANAEKDKV
jgi:hypothetical protein